MFLTDLQQIIKPGESKNSGGAPSSGGLVLINDRREIISQGGSGQQRQAKQQTAASDFSKLEIQKLPLLKGNIEYLS